jgi:YVTN family beta-propeller protein
VPAIHQNPQIKAANETGLSSIFIRSRIQYLNSAAPVDIYEATIVESQRPSVYPEAITPDRTKAYIADASAKTVSVIGTTTNTVVATVGVGAIPVHVSVSPGGSQVYVTNAGSNSVSVIDVSTNAVTAAVPVGVLPVNAAVF